MTKKSMQYFFAASILAALLIGSSAFTKKAKDITNGGGIAEGHFFNYTAVENKSGVAGHFSWDGTDYDVVCVYKSGNTATIYLSDNMAVNVVDSKDGDWISAPFSVQTTDCSVASISPDSPLAVDSGNLTVHK
jgi:hypothetical protein